jgi:hypothetical protein
MFVEESIVTVVLKIATHIKILNKMVCVLFVWEFAFALVAFEMKK